MVAPVLLLVALIGQSSPVPDTTVVIQESVVAVAVSPLTVERSKPSRCSRTQKATPRLPKALKPRTRGALPKRGVLATFDLLSTAFHVVVTLDEGSVHRVDEQEKSRGSRTICPFLVDLPPMGPAKGY